MPKATGKNYRNLTPLQFVVAPTLNTGFVSIAVARVTGHSMVVIFVTMLRIVDEAVRSKHQAT